ncbi:MAG: class I SAM-dependent DNA methyltransferase [Phototrophicaceae bacterium]
MDHTLYDQRRYPITEVVEGYGEWATTYEQTVLDLMDLRLLGQLSQVSWGSAQAILDLACGTGRIGAWLQQRTVAPLDGIDLTPQMLEQAHAKQIYRQLFRGDITHTTLADASYDLCIQSLADEHLPALAPLYAEAARLTRPSGEFVLVGYHPFFMMMGIPTHYNRADGNPATIRTYVHLLSDHIKAGMAHGWTLCQLEEGLIDAEWVAQKPKWQKYLGIPISFAMHWKK